MEGIEEAADIAPRPKHRRHGQSWALREQRLPLRLRTEKPTSESPVTSHSCAPATTSPIPVEWFLTNSNVDAAAEFTVRLVRDGSGRLGLGLNEANFITELSEAARANGLALLDQVCSVDGVQLGSQKLGRSSPSSRRSTDMSCLSAACLLNGGMPWRWRGGSRKKPRDRSSTPSLDLSAQAVCGGRVQLQCSTASSAPRQLGVRPLPVECTARIAW